jgi:hypothetical protein
MDLECTNIFHCNTRQNLPKLGFLVRKSGNPDPALVLKGYYFLVFAAAAGGAIKIKVVIARAKS